MLHPIQVDTLRHSSKLAMLSARYLRAFLADVSSLPAFLMASCPEICPSLARPVATCTPSPKRRCLIEIHIGVLTHYTSGVRNGRLCQELHLHSSAWWADVCQFQFTTLGWLKLVLNIILSICPHNRQRSACKDCGGTSICPHNRQRSVCKDCGGASICQHNRQRSNCKDCGGSGICAHYRIRSQCKECKRRRAELAAANAQP